MQAQLNVKKYLRLADNCFFVVKTWAVDKLLEVLADVRPYTGKIESLGSSSEVFDFNLFHFWNLFFDFGGSMLRLFGDGKYL